MLSLKTMKGIASWEGGMALMRPLWAGKASTAAATSKAPDKIFFCGRGVDAQDPQNSEAEDLPKCPTA